jgi:uncharacterized protein with FMN-binding domain
MRRVILAVVTTAVVLLLLLSFKSYTSTSPLAPAAVAGPDPSTGSTSTGSTGTGSTSTGSTGTGSTGTGSTSTGSTGTPSTSAPATGSSVTPDATATSGGTSAGAKTVTGDVVQTIYGPVQVRITVANGKVTVAAAIQYPDGTPRDSQINAFAIPQLQQETIGVSTPNIDAVSGATYTSQGYIGSLQSALDKAGL